MSIIREGQRNRNLAILLKFMAVLVGMVVAYSVTFHWIMEWEGQHHSWVTGFYWTLVVMTTLGFGDITFQSDVGRLFSMLVLMSGVLFLLVLLPFTFIQFFYAPWMESQAQARAPRSLPMDTHDHVVLTSYDPVCQSLIPRLRQYGIPYCVLVPDVAEALRLHDIGVRVMVGELDDPEVYRQARVDRAAMVATTIASDPINTNVVFTVRELSDKVPIVSTVRDPDAIDILHLAGSSYVLQLSEIMGRALARSAFGGDSHAHVIGHFGELLVAEASTAETPLVGKTLREARLAETVGVNAVGLWERGRFESAGPETRIGEKSVLMLGGTRLQLDHYNELFGGYHQVQGAVVIVGGGRVGRSTGDALAGRGLDFTIVERDAGRVRPGARYVQGNAAEMAILEKAGIREAPAAIITTHDDDVNIYLTIYLRRLRPDLQIIARCTRERNVATLHRAGADFVLSYASMGANAVFNLLRRGSVLMVAEGLYVFRAAVPGGLVGRSLIESRFRQLSGCSVIAIQHEDRMEVNPDPHQPLGDSMQLVLIGTAEAEERYLKAFERNGR